MKKLLLIGAAVALAACASTGGSAGPRTDWRCAGGAAFSARINTGGEGTADVFAGGQVYRLSRVAGASGLRYSNGQVEYWERGGSATLSGARGGPYNNCRRG
jgi:membrane-bound inhibitor of C-type lysozyme